jgi:hypothetical protein
LSEVRLEEVVDAATMAYEEASSADDFRRELRRQLVPLSEAPAPHVYQCGVCGRLAIFRHPSDRSVSQWYRPDEGEMAAGVRLRDL